jgi:hypothetical protein
VVPVVPFGRRRPRRDDEDDVAEVDDAPRLEREGRPDIAKKFVPKKKKEGIKQ